MKLKNKIKITTQLELISGLHIGDSKENTDIGGIDNPVIRRKDNMQPYIPGSSLKGKIRSLLEQMAGIGKVGGGHDKNLNDKSPECQAINKTFGFANDNLPSRIIFRDAYLSEQSADLLSKSNATDMPFTEAKAENTIDRVKGKADNPRTQERVPAGAIFNLEFVINDMEDHPAEESKKLLLRGLKALNNDYLGGSGSRGSGHVRVALDDEEAWKEIKIEL